MKNLNENAMMQEMNMQEMKEVNGGFGWETVFEALLMEFLDPKKEDDFNEGHQAARDFWGS